MPPKPRVDKSADASFAILGICTLLGLAGAPGYYVWTAYAGIAKLKAENPGRELQVRINYLNFPHMEVLIYGLIGGLIVGAVGATIAGWFRKGPAASVQTEAAP